MRRTVALLALTGFVLARPASADPIFITHTFDDRAPGVQGFFDQGLYLVSIQPGTGTVFNSVEIAASPHATSAPHVVRPGQPGWGVQGLFLSDGVPQLTLATRFLFFDITGPADQANPWIFSIFDRDGLLIESHTGTIPVGMGFRRRGPGATGPGIASFIFQPGLPLHGLDNVRYEAPIVPEPTTMLLVGSGLAAAAWRRRRRVRRTS